MSTINHIATFFARYAPKFTYNPANSAAVEFYRLCGTYGWERYNVHRIIAHNAYNRALTLQFNANYGTDMNDLASWQLVCQHLMGIGQVLGTLDECRSEVLRSFFNLVDLVDVFAHGGKALRFQSREALMEYTRKKGKIFPQKDNNAGFLLMLIIGKRWNDASLLNFMQVLDQVVERKWHPHIV